MKKIILFLATASCVNMTAQSLQLINFSTGATLAPNAIVDLTVAPGGNSKYTIDIKNIGVSTKTYTAKRYDVLRHTVTPDTASAYFCFGGLCYGPDTKVSPNTIILNPGKKASDTAVASYMLLADLDEVPSQCGKSLIKYTFYDVNSPNFSDSAQITLRYDCSTVGLEEFKNAGQLISLFPNPCNDIATIRIQSPVGGNASVSMINLLGQTVFNKQVHLEAGSNNVRINVKEFSPGAYYISMSTDGGDALKKLIITK